jgi:hypothetical protein
MILTMLQTAVSLFWPNGFAEKTGMAATVGANHGVAEGVFRVFFDDGNFALRVGAKGDQRSHLVDGTMPVTSTECRKEGPRVCATGSMKALLVEIVALERPRRITALTFILGARLTTDWTLS